MNPTLYDILGVRADASRDEIRKAWRESADRFEPGEGGSTRQFRLFNEAAEVLLDPERRKEYDEQLVSTDAPGSVPGPPMPGAARAVTPPVQGGKARDAGQKPGTTAPTKPAPTTQPDAKAAGKPVKLEKAGKAAAAATKTSTNDEPVRRPATQPDERTDGPEPAATTSGARRGVGRPLLAVLGVLAAVAVGVAAYFVISAQRTADYQEALDRAPAAAESAATAVLSYDHESLEADRDAAAKFLSEGYRSDYVDTFDKLVSDNATQTKATVEAEVLASSAMLGTPGGDCEGDEPCETGERDPDRIPVLLFVNQTTTSTASSGEPSVALNRVRFDMVNVDGTWLVDGITSY
jgi:Mce-associated membrane protein